MHVRILLCSLAAVAVAGIFSSARAVEKSPASAALPPLPEAVSSFGGAIADNWLYVYSGHTGEAHAHSKRNLSQKFLRLRLDAPSEWETLPAGPGLQGLPLVAHDGCIYRIGGLSAHNEPGAEAELESVRDFAKFDPKSMQWTSLAPLPEGRSSHDAVVADGKLYVVGGWTLGKEQTWLKHSVVFDFGRPEDGWKKIEQPFERRALAVAAHDGKIYAMGGMTPMGPSLDVQVYDIAGGSWSAGPAVPEGIDTKIMNGFGASAFGVGGKLYLSTMDGALLALSADAKSWEKFGMVETPRFFHRLLPAGDEFLIVAGASHKVGHVATIERIAMPK